MQATRTVARGIAAGFHWVVDHLRGRLADWDRVYLCSVAPLSAEFVRDTEDAQEHHRQW